MKDEIISIDDIINIVILYWHMTVLKFSTKYKSKHGWKLSNDNTMVERIKAGGLATQTEDYNLKKWILADTDPWFDGVHCWRIQLKNPNKGWWSIGVANQNIDNLNRSSFGTNGVWAIGANDNYYRAGYGDAFIKGGSDIKKYFVLEYVEMDVYLNLDGDEPEMKMCVVNDKEPLREVVLSASKKDPKGCVPYFNMHYGDAFGNLTWNAIGATMRAVFIEPDCYGIPIENLFSYST